MNVNMTLSLEDYVQQKVASGDYNNASEVIREALRLLKERDQLREARLHDLRQAIVDRGQPEPLENIDTLLQMAREYRADKRQSLAS